MVASNETPGNPYRVEPMESGGYLLALEPDGRQAVSIEEQPEGGMIAVGLIEGKPIGCILSTDGQLAVTLHVNGRRFVLRHDGRYLHFSTDQPGVPADRLVFTVGEDGRLSQIIKE